MQLQHTSEKRLRSPNGSTCMYDATVLQARATGTCEYMDFIMIACNLFPGCALAFRHMQLHWGRGWLMGVWRVWRVARESMGEVRAAEESVVWACAREGVAPPRRLPRCTCVVIGAVKAAAGSHSDWNALAAV